MIYGRCLVFKEVFLAHLKNWMETATLSCVEGNGIVVLVLSVS